MILRMTARLRPTAVTASRRSLFIRMMSALSMATSVPAPMAMPTSAAARAGASLIPSPIMATLWPPAFSSRIFFSLSWGRTSATTSAMPSCLRTASAVLLLSPVSITTRMPIFWNFRMATSEEGLISSATAI